MNELGHLLGKSLPTDHSNQVVSANYVLDELKSSKGPLRVLDLGCGQGNSVELFNKLSAKIIWTGIDIEDSPEVASRTREDVEFVTFDGVHIPFDDDHFDVVYSNQVLEHVRKPEDLLGEVNRVLKEGGLFIGSTSQLEAYHSYSIFNFTPYGFKVICVDAGLILAEIRPSIDGITLPLRRLLGNPSCFSRWWNRESPVNAWLSFRGRRRASSHAEVNAEKLLLCGQFVFKLVKPQSE